MSARRNFCKGMGGGVGELKKVLNMEKKVLHMVLKRPTEENKKRLH